MSLDATELLEAFLEREHPGFADDKRLHDAARAISHAYTTVAPTGERVLSNDAASSLAYLAHFGPRAIAAVSHALAFARVPAACVDVGAGSGASALALFAHGARSITLVDASAKSLALAQRLLAFARGAAARPLDVRVVEARVGERACVDAKAELLLSAFLFGELEGEPTAGLAALAQAAPNARALVLVDAGDRARARRIQTARDAVASGALALRTATLRGPCAHSEPCPALVRERDWCHARFDKALPEKLARFARAVGRDDERMSASFLVLDDGPPDAASAIVVIGDALKEKGRARLPVCGPGGLRFLQALKRDRAAHDALLAVPRGARVPLDAARDVRDGTAHVTDPVVLPRA